MLNRIIINSLTHDGRGIGEINGKKVFLENALPGEEVVFDITKHHSSFDEGKVLEIIKPSEVRQVPKCPHFDICGGCSLQHMSSLAQIAFKQDVLLEQLAHFAGVIPKEVISPIIGPIWSYRNKARLSTKFVSKKNKVLVGFHEKQGRFIADLQSCAILHPAIGEKLVELAQLISSLSIYQFIPQVEIAIGDNFKALIFRILKDANSEDIEKLLKFGKEFGFVIYLQPNGNNSIFAITEIPDDLLSYTLTDLDIKLFFQPTDFTQVNQEINKQMVARVLELLGPKPDEQILDLFCGLGNFTLPIAKYCGKIVGVEGDSQMVMRAKTNAHYNKIINAEFYKADLTKDLASEPWARQKFNKILLDPPRTGAFEVVANIEKFQAKKIVYVSCNPATLARDAKELSRQGYELIKVGVMDMFPHTKHVEAIAVFSKK